jgi:hypothetical protein
MRRWITALFVFLTACSTGYMPIENKKSDHIAAIHHIQLGPYEASFSLSSRKGNDSVLVAVSLQLVSTQPTNLPADLKKAPVQIELRPVVKDSSSKKNTSSYQLLTVNGPLHSLSIEGNNWVYFFLAANRRSFDRNIRITLSIEVEENGMLLTIRKSFLMKKYSHLHLLH